MLKTITLSCASLFCVFSSAQQIEITGSRKTVRTAGNVISVALPAACAATTIALKDWDGMKQGAIAGASSVALTYVLKEFIDKDRPDHSDNRSFPSRHSAISFTSAAFIQKRYGWKWGTPAYAAASFAGWSRVYGKKHDWWDVMAGTSIGVTSAYIFTKPFAQKHNLSITPSASPEYFGFYASMNF